MRADRPVKAGLRAGGGLCLDRDSPGEIFQDDGTVLYLDYDDSCVY